MNHRMNKENKEKINKLLTELSLLEEETYKGQVSSNEYKEKSKEIVDQINRISGKELL